jgi:hypothetical protein
MLLVVGVIGACKKDPAAPSDPTSALSEPLRGALPNGR